MLFEAFITLSCILVSVTSQGSVDLGDCVEYSGYYGEEVFCGEGRVAMGACGSGRDLDCFGFSHILRCCAVIAAEEEKSLACSSADGDYGVSFDCPASQQVVTLCASGSGPDCGLDTYARTTCCDGNGITTTDNAFCRWSGDVQGRWVTCGASEVMMGYCGSGRDPDCDGNYIRVKCCSYE